MLNGIAQYRCPVVSLSHSGILLRKEPGFARHGETRYHIVGYVASQRCFSNSLCDAVRRSLAFNEHDDFGGQGASE